MKHKTFCSDAYYRCPFCDICYCEHTHDDENNTWSCPDGVKTTRSNLDHTAAHAMLERS